MSPSRVFLLYHAVIPGLFLALALVWIYHYQIDYALADILYRWEGGQWSLRHTWLFKELIHNDGKILARSFPLLTMGYLITTFYQDKWKPYRRALVYLIVIPLCSVAIVNLLKAFSGTACPADYLRYGGHLPLQESWGFELLGKRGCTPAGHSSGGYAWLATYFVAYIHAPRWRFYALLPGILLGLVYGFSQQLRGEHFFSHDVWTIAICWFTALMGYMLLFENKTEFT